MKMDTGDILSNLEFSEDTPVRAMLLQKQHYAILRIALGKSTKIMPHEDAHPVFFLILKGKGIFTCGEKEIELGPNQYIHIEKDEKRGIQALEDLVLFAIKE
jgi:quercetin dioxygenase-like cupin family protein